MSRYLATFSGRVGDILWSLATVRQLSRRVGEAIDFGIMPEYESLLPLLQAQDYIDKAMTIRDWKFTGSPFGDQPWEAPVATLPFQYEKVWHLTYRTHPTAEPLMNHIATQQDVRFKTSPVPWLSPGTETIADPLHPNQVLVTYGFSGKYRQEKLDFIGRLSQAFPGVRFLCVDNLDIPWQCAAALIKRSAAFVGCRSALYVIAHAVGTRVLVYEPQTERRPLIFGCPYGTEVMPLVQGFDAFAAALDMWVGAEVLAEKDVM